jgi:hypothetical protein
VVGQIAAFPMRFNFYEHVRGQLSGELEELLATMKLAPVKWCRSFLGYIHVLRIVKPVRDRPLHRAN